MDRSVLGGILAAIALLFIYGTSASSRFASWLDRDRSPTAQTNSNQRDSLSDETLVAFNATETNGDAIVDVSGMTPLEKAGTLPKRQTIGAIGADSNFGGGTPATPSTVPAPDVEGVVVPNPTPVVEQPPAAAPAPVNNPAPVQQPIRALW